MTKKLLLIDFNAIFCRSRSALLKSGRQYTTADGTPTTGVFSTLNTILSIIKSQSPTHVVICYDAGGNVRKTESDTYKANRTPVSNDFVIEANVLKDEAFYSMGLETVGIRGVEADDILYTFAHLAQFGPGRFDEIVIATVDQDLLQCVTSRCKVLLFNFAKKQELMGVDEVVEKWGCGPDDIRYVKAISGDSSDNIIGVKGVGPKTAIKILEESKWLLDAACEHKKLKEHKELIKSNLDLVVLRNVAGTLGPIAWSDHLLGQGMEKDYVDFLEKYEFSSLLKRASSTAKLLSLR